MTAPTLSPSSYTRYTVRCARGHEVIDYPHGARAGRVDSEAGALCVATREAELCGRVGCDLGPASVTSRTVKRDRHATVPTDAVVDALTASTRAEYDAAVAAGCVPLSPAEYESRVNALGYSLVRGTRYAVGAYVNRSNARHYRAYGVTYHLAGTSQSFAHVDAPRDRLPELQALRRESVVFHGGRVWEL